jgi:hypothetical protein
VSAQEAVAVIKPGDRVFVHSVAAAPRVLLEAMTARAPELRVVEVISLHTEGPAPYAAPEMAPSFRVNALFVGANVRQAIHDGRADYLPVFLSEVPRLLRAGILPLDVALVQVSPPDRHGFCSLGVSVDDPGRGPDGEDGHRPGEPAHAAHPWRRPDPRGEHRLRDGGRTHPRALAPGPPRRRSPSASTAPSWWRTAPRSRSARRHPRLDAGGLSGHHRLGIHTEMLDGVVDLVEKGWSPAR